MQELNFVNIKLIFAKYLPLLVFKVFNLSLI